MGQIITRSEWGAEHPAGFRAAPLPAREVWLHHSVTTAPSATASLNLDAAAVRLLEEIGQQRFGGGISYTFVIPPSGRVFEGHGVARQGAHTKGHNTVGRAICLIGNYETAHPTDEQFDAVAALLRHGHREGWWERAELAGGHRDVPGAATACPGRHAYALIGEINRRALQEDDMFTDADRATLNALATHLGFARDQIMTHVGKNPTAAPLPPQQLAGVEVARRVDVGSALDQIMTRLHAIEARLPEPAPDPEPALPPERNRSS